MEPIRSPRNPRVVAAARLHRVRERTATGRTLLEGPHVLAEALSCGIVVDTVFHLPDDTVTSDVCAASDIAAVTVGPDALARLAGTSHPRGPIAVIEVPELGQARDRDVLLVEVGEPGNAGTLIRSAAAFGFDVAFAAGSVDPWAPKVLRSAAGGHFHLRVTDPGSVGSRPHLVSVVDGGAAAADAVRAVEGPVVLVVGHEARGAAIDGFPNSMGVTISMASSVESLNAAVAGSILMHEIARLRRCGGRG